MYWEKNKFRKMAAFEKFFVFRLFADVFPMAPPSVEEESQLPSIVLVDVVTSSLAVEQDGIGILSFNLSLSFVFVVEPGSGSCS